MFALLSSHHPVWTLAVIVMAACVGLIVATACKAVDDWYAAGAEQRAKNRRTDKRAALALGAWWRR